MNKYTLNGTIKATSQATFRQLTIEVWDKEPQKDRQLYKVSVDEKGNFTIPFSATTFRNKPTFSLTGVYLKVYQGKKLLLSTEKQSIKELMTGEGKQILLDLGGKESNVSNAERAYRLEVLSGISKEKAEKIRKSLGKKALNYSFKGVQGLMQKGLLNAQEGQTLHLVSTLAALPNMSDQVLTSLKDKQWASLGNQSASSLKDMVVLERADIVAALEEDERLDLSKGAKEQMADGVLKALETTFPTERLIQGIVLPKTQLNALLKDSITNEESEKRATGLLKTYQAFGWQGMMKDETIPIADKMAKIAGNMGTVEQFFVQNPDFNLLEASLTKTGLQQYDFKDIDPKDQVPLVQTLKNFLRVLKVAPNTAVAKRLLAEGYASSFDVANDSLSGLMKKTGLPQQEATSLYQVAKSQAVRVVNVLFGLKESHSPTMDSTAPGGAPALIPAEHDLLAELDDYEDFFGNQSFCTCKDCASILSPAAYFVDLMDYIEKNITQNSFTGEQEDHFLKLRNRRPDLWNLPLTCENTNQRIPYLTIIMDVLEQYLVQRQGWTEENLYQELSQSVESFNQPFHLPLATLSAYLEHFDLELEGLLNLLAPKSLATSYAQLNLSEEAANLLKQPSTDRAFLESLYGFNVNDLAAIEVPVFLPKTGLSRDEFGEVLKTNFVKGTSEVRIVAGRKSEESIQNDVEFVENSTLEVLDRLHRFVRLWRGLSWTMEELDLVLSMVNMDLVAIAKVRQIQLALKPMPLKHLLGVLGQVPEEIFEEVFNLPYFKKLEGALPDDSKWLLHPAFKEQDDVIEDPMVHRLLAGLQLSDDDLLLLIQHLTVELRLGQDPKNLRIQLSRTNLSLLYQQVTLAEALELSIADFILLKQVARVDDLREKALQDVEKIISVYNEIKASPLSIKEWHGLTESTALAIETAKEWRTKLFALLEEGIFNTELELDPKAFVHKLLPEVTAVPVEILDVLFLWLDISIESSELFSYWKENDLDNTFVEKLLPLAQWLLLVDRFSLTVEELQAFEKNKSLLGLEKGSPRALVTENLNYLTRYYLLKARLDLELEQVDLFYLLEEMSTSKQAVLSEELLMAATVREDYLRLLLQYVALPKHPLDALTHLLNTLETAQLLGINGESLSLILSNDYDKLERASQALVAAFRSKYTPDLANDLGQSIENKLLEAKRTALSDYLINSIHPEFTNKHDLYYYFMLDTELESCATSSRVLAANASLQLYVQRVMMQLEKDQDNQVLAALAEGEKEWEWRKNYRVWEANRKVFLYPENYIRPELRSDKTPLFKLLEDSLLQQDVTGASVGEAYKNYLTQFSEIANLKFAGAYHHQGVLHMIGRTVHDPKAHYYRTHDLSSNKWSAWTKIEVPILADQLSPIIFKNTLYIFWFEIVSKPIKQIVNGTSELNYYEHVIHLKYTSIQTNGKWQQAQTITLPNLGAIDPNSKEGKIREYITDNGTLIISKKKVEDIDDTYSLDGIRWSRPYLFINNEKDEEQITLYYDHHIGHLGDIYFNLSLYQNEATETNKVSTAEVIPNINRYIFRAYPEGHLTVRFLDNYSAPSIAYTSSMSYYYNASGLSMERDTDPAAFVLAKYSLEINPPKIYAINNLVDYHVIEFDRVAYLMVPQHDHVEASPYRAIRLTTDLAAQLAEKVQTSGLDKMLQLSTQKDSLEYDALYQSTGIAISGFIRSYHSKFIESAPYSIYMRELFFHIPSLIAAQLNNNRKYKEAQEWYHYIFNPLAKDTNPHIIFPYDRVWQYLGFRSKNIWSLRHLLTNTTAIDTYKNDPFNPHAIAAVRQGTYQKTTVMNYIDNLLDWGDQLFGMDTFESINEASLLYIMASDILGKRPVDIGDCERPSGDYVQSYEGMNNNLLDGNNNEFLKEIEAMLYTLERSEGAVDKKSSATTRNKSIAKSSSKSMQLAATKMALANNSNASNASNSPLPTSNYLGNSAYQSNGEIKKPLVIDISGAVTPTVGQNFIPTTNGNDSYNPPTNIVLELATQKALLFCVPNNHQLLDYWDRVEDRLYKIRHCMNLQGTKRPLELLQPAIDPMMLVRARATGLSIQDILAELADSKNTLYQFRYLLEKANGLAAFAQSLGGAMLSALEKRDAETLSLIRSEHQLNLQQMETQLQEQRIIEIQKGRESITLRKEQTTYRLNYYQGLIDGNLIKEEKQQLNLKSSAQGFMDMNLGLYLGRGLASAVHPKVLGLAGFEFNPAKIFDSMLNNRITRHSALTGILQSRASTQSIHASYKRRLKGWKYQEQLIKEELKAIEKQEIINAIQLKGAEHGLNMHYRRIEYTQEVYDFLKNRFGNKQLYSWLTNELQGMYRQAYKMAYEMAKEAEAAYRFELNKEAASFIQPANWESQKAGLLAGQKLAMQLTQLDHAYHNSAERKMEVQQSFSLRLTNPKQLLQLQETGTCAIELSEMLFDLVYPGQYKRRLRSINITIPCVTGPYTNVNATLTLMNSKRRKSIDSALESVNNADNNQVALSGGDSDSGLLFTDFYANKYLPFEGAGAISNWKLELPNAYKSFDYKTISDVIVNVAYTAQYDGSQDKKVVEDRLRADLASHAMIGMTQYLNLKQHFSSEFRHLLLRAPHQTALTINERFLPYYLQSRLAHVKIEKVNLIIEKSAQEDWAAINSNLTVDNVPLTFDSGFDLGLGDNFKSYSVDNLEGQSFNQIWSLAVNDVTGELGEGLKNIHILIDYYLDGEMLPSA